MQFWSWLTGGKRKLEQPDMISLTNRARLVGVCQSIKEKSRNCQLLIVTSHFSDRLAEMREVLDRNAVAYRDVENRLRPSETQREIAGRSSATVFLAPANLLANDDPPVPVPIGDPPDRVAVLVVERHLLGMYDERIEHFAAAIPFEAELQFFLALDDAGMQMFAGDWVRDVLKRLGMKEDEALTSSMVTRRLKRAQRQVEARYEALQGLKRGLALERLRAEPPREWKNAEDWLAEHRMGVVA